MVYFVYNVIPLYFTLTSTSTHPPPTVSYSQQDLEDINAWGRNIFRVDEHSHNRPLTGIMYTIFQVSLLLHTHTHRRTHTQTHTHTLVLYVKGIRKE